MTKDGNDYSTSQIRSLVYQTIESIAPLFLGKLQTEISSAFEYLKEEEESPPMSDSISPPTRDMVQLVKLTTAEHLVVRALYENPIMTAGSLAAALVSGGAEFRSTHDVIASVREWGLVLRLSAPGHYEYRLTRLGQIYMDGLEEIVNGVIMD